MANNASNQDYDSMSREELMQIIGTDVAADTPREDLVAMARKRDSDTGLNAA